MKYDLYSQMVTGDGTIKNGGLIRAGFNGDHGEIFLSYRSVGEKMYVELGRDEALALARQLIVSALRSVGSYWPQTVDGICLLADIRDHAADFIAELEADPFYECGDGALVVALRERDEKRARELDLKTFYPATPLSD
jgi:hypothetical protein